jgi:hypothetical protein
MRLLKFAWRCGLIMLFTVSFSVAYAQHESFAIEEWHQKLSSETDINNNSFKKLLDMHVVG